MIAVRRPSKSARILSWNVNGLRAAAKKGFLDFLAAARPEILGVQEVRAAADDLPHEVRTPRRLFAHFAAAERRGYSGVGLYARRPPDEISSALGVPEFDREGRFLLARFGRLHVVNAYFPNGNGIQRDNSRIPYKLAFYGHLRERLLALVRSGERVLVMGDFNTTHRDIDLARPKENVATSGCRPEEREEFDRWIACGFADTFRQFEPGPGHYSWWAQRAAARARNVGWRIDYVLASPAALPFVKRAFILPDVMGSDHCPVGVDVDRAVFGVDAPR